MKKILVSIASLALASSVLAANCPGPDVFGHTCSATPCATIAGITNPVGALFDDSCVNRAIGFSFNFYGAAFTQVGVASNGFLQLGGCGTGSTDFTNDCPIPNAAATNNAAYGVWDDLNASGINVTDGLTGAAPNRVYTVNFPNVPYFSGAGTTTFQIQLHEAGGGGEEVRVQIVNEAQGLYTTGIENGAGTDALMFTCNTFSAVCTRYAGGIVIPPGGDCDLTPVLTALNLIENKLDTDIPADLAAILTEVTNISAANCEIIRLLHTPQGRRTSSSADNGGCGDFTWNQDHGGGE